MYRLLVASNFCLDMPLPEYSPDARNYRRQESLACLSSFFQEAISRKYDAVIISGNLFYRPYPSREAFEALIQGYERLSEAGIPLLLLEGDRDRGPFYREPVHPVPVLSEGQSIELLPGLPVCITSTLPLEKNRIYLWQEENSVPAIPTGTLVLTTKPALQTEQIGLLLPGIPLRLDFDLPEEPSVTRVDWADGLQNTENIPFPDRIYATFDWDVNERGEDLVPYLEESQEPDLCLRIIITGTVNEPLSVDAWIQRFRNGFFLLKLEDQTRFVQTEQCPPLVHELFKNKIAELLGEENLPPELSRLYRRAWTIGQTALKGGDRRAN